MRKLFTDYSKQKDFLTFSRSPVFKLSEFLFCSFNLPRCNWFNRVSNDIFQFVGGQRRVDKRYYIYGEQEKLVSIPANYRSGTSEIRVFLPSGKPYTIVVQVIAAIGFRSRFALFVCNFIIQRESLGQLCESALKLIEINFFFSLVIRISRAYESTQSNSEECFKNKLHINSPITQTLPKGLSQCLEVFDFDSRKAGVW